MSLSKAALKYETHIEENGSNLSGGQNSELPLREHS
jgi:ABC-type bacteriocin/lantibiotic exporter with double-glycine peptidase domain